ncbi:MAG: amidohydrolase family protein [Bacillota bacterium]|nr:amidohydrolase family protein [Bacillota bacterium]
MLIDIHGHIGRISPNRNEFIDVTNVIAKMDAWGIDKTCLLPLSEHPEGAYLESDTEDIIAACRKYPDRLFSFCLIDPRYGNRPDMDFRHLLTEYRLRGCRGLGELLPKMDFDDPRCLNLYRQAGEFDFPVLFDMMDSAYSYGLCDSLGLPRLEHALKACPDTVFIGHGPTFWAEISLEVPPDQRSGYPTGPVVKSGAVPRLMRQYANLWADISAHSGYNALTRDYGFGIEYIDEFQDRLMFGTDSCLRSDLARPNKQVHYIKELKEKQKLSDAALDKLMWKNSVRLLRLDE